MIKRQKSIRKLLSIIVVVLIGSIIFMSGCGSKSNDDATAQQEGINGFTLKHGELLDANPNGGADGNTLVIKAKIESNLTNKLTIDQNYFNVEDIIKNQGGSEFECIDYWAVADMSDGSEEKVISFTLDSDTIEAISEERIAANKIGDYASDLFIHQSLQ